MRALVCQELSDDLDRLGIEEVATPEPGAGEVRVRVMAASLNFPDLLMARGGYQFKPDLPFVCGMDFAGVIDSLGVGVTGFAVGDRVAGGGKQGAFADFKVTAADALAHMPDAMSFEAAAAFPAAYQTAHVALLTLGRLKAGETLLVHGASGGVGMAAMDVGRMTGATVIATTSNLAKREALLAAGADHVLAVDGDMREEVKALTGGRGADVVFDPVGGDAFEQSMRCIAFGGRMLVVGFAGGRVPEVKLNHVLIKGVQVIGVRAGEYGRQFPEEGVRIRREIWNWAAKGLVRPVISMRVPLVRWREVYEAMRDRRLTGKAVISMD